MPPEKLEILTESPKVELDYAQLEAEKKAIFARIIEDQDFSEEERNFLIARVFEHSIEDGLEVADILSLDREARTEAITRYAFMKKHQDFVSKLRNKLVEYSPFASEQDRDEITNLTEEISRDIKKPEGIGRIRSRKGSVDFGDEAEKFLSQIDDYYTQFLRFRGVKEKEVPVDKLSKGEKTAEQALVQDLRALEPHYYTDPIRDLVGEGQPLLLKPLIKQSDLTELFARLHLSLDDEDVKKKLEQARYRPVHMIWSLLHKDGEKELRAEIVNDLKNRGYKDEDFELIFDDQKRQYRVLNKTPEHQELKKENLRLVKELPMVFEMKPDDPYYAKAQKIFEDRDYDFDNNWRDRSQKDLLFRREVQIIDGQIFQQIAWSDWSFIIYPDGRRSDIFFAIQGEWHVTKKGLAFMINDPEGRGGENDFQLTIDGKKIGKDESWDFGLKYIESIDGVIYSVANQFDYGRQIGKYALFKDDQMIESFPYGQRPCKLSLINNKLTYFLEGKDESSLIYGDEVFGPYKKIRKDEDSKDLVFVAEKANGEKILHFNNMEHNFSAEGEIMDTVMTSDNVYVLMSRVIKKGDTPYDEDKKTFWIVDKDGNKITEESDNGIRDFCSIDNKLFYSIPSSNEKDESQSIYFDGHKKDVTEGIKPVGILGGDLFYYSNSSIYSLRSGKIDFSKDSLRSYNDNVKIVDGKLIIVTKSEKLTTVFEWSPEFQLEEESLRKLELLNALKSESLEIIEAYFNKYYPKEVEKGLIERLKGLYENSKNFAQSISTIIKDKPALFLRDISAKKDDLTDANIDQFISSLFPEIKTNLERAKNKAKYKRNRRDRDSSIRSCFNGSGESNEFNDGDPMEENSPEVLKLREPITEFLSTGIYGQYNKNRRSWEQVGFSISQTHIGPTREVTAEIPVVKYMGNIILPKCLDGVIIPERVKGIKSNGEEVLLAVTVNTLGEARIKLPDELELEKIVYSQTLQDLPTVPVEISEKEYEDFRKKNNKRFGQSISEKIALLPEELRIFVNSLKDKTPVEKLEEIESFVRSIGYYDFNNGEMQSLKHGKGLEENFSIMNQRMKELRRKKPEEAEKLAHKKYAGVCSDFAKLTTALLREAGFVSGMIMGLQPSGGETSITTKNAHAVAYALWPSDQGKAKAILLDGTPAGMSEAEEKLLSGIRQKSLKERRKIFDEGKGKVVEDADKLLKDLEDLIANLDEEGIKKLKNGKLEKALNVILGQVRESHLSVIDTVLNASRYAGFDVNKIVNSGEIEDELALRKFLESEISRERKTGGENKHFMGENLLKSIEEFVSAYERDKGVDGKKKAFDIVERVFDISKNSLDPIESRSAIVVITYLRSEHMTSR